MRFVAFFSYGSQPCASLMVKSVRHHMPGWAVLQLTDETSDRVEGVDEVYRLPLLEPKLKSRFEHLSHLDGHEVLCLDTDVLLKANIGFVFDRSPFDVALTYRDHDVFDPNGVNVARVMPYNTGVMFSRCPQFWADCVREYLPTEDWYGDQLAVKSVADSGRYRVMRLPATKFNFTPDREDRIEDAFVYHYKGPEKKAWMQRHAH